MNSREFDNHTRSEEDITLTGTFCLCFFSLVLDAAYHDFEVFMMLMLIFQIKFLLALILMLL